MDNIPRYPNDADYTTNAPSYYDDLARKTDLMKYLAKRVWEFDKEMAIRLAEWDGKLSSLNADVIALLKEWIDDGTFAEIINEEIFGMKADTTWVQAQLNLKSRATSINVIDYGAKGDGVTNDTAAIQAAITAGAGKEVVFPAGTFMIHSLIKIKSNTKITMQPTTTLKRNSDTNAMFMNDSDGSIGGYDANSNITIQGGNVDVNKTQFPTKCTPFGFGHAKNITIKNVSFKNMYQWHYIEFSAVKNGLIENCIFDGHVMDNMSEQVQIDIHYGSNGFPWFGPYDNTACDSVIVRGCTFTDGVRGVGTHSGFTGVHQTNISILDNHFSNMRGECVALYNYKDSIVKGNHMTNAVTGVYVYSSDSTNSQGIQIVDNTIENMYKSVNSRGIHIDDGNETIIIRGNVITLVNRHGISVDKSNKAIVDGNIVSGCRLTGIYLYGSYDVSCTNNKLFGNNTDNAADSFDIQVGQEGLVSAFDNIITNNHMGTLGLMRSVNTGVFHNRIDSVTYGSVTTDLRMVDNNIGGSWVTRV